MALQLLKTGLLDLRQPQRFVQQNNCSASKTFVLNFWPYPGFNIGILIIILINSDKSFFFFSTDFCARPVELLLLIAIGWVAVAERRSIAEFPTDIFRKAHLSFD